MSVQDILNKRFSVRNYLSKPIEKDVLEKIIELAIRSPSAGNMQAWSVVVTQNAELKHKLYEIHYEQEMILQAPVVLTFCADFHRMCLWLKLNNAKNGFDDLSGFTTAMVDAVIAAQSVSLLAEEYGLGSCYMGTTLWEASKISDLLKLPELVVPVTSLVLGYKNEVQELRDRLPLEGMLHYEHYQNFLSSDIQKIYHERNEKGWKRYTQKSEMLERFKQHGIENLAQFYTSDLKYSKTFFAEKAHEYLQLLKAKGYWNF